MSRPAKNEGRHQEENQAASSGSETAIDVTARASEPASRGRWAKPVGNQFNSPRASIELRLTPPARSLNPD